MLFVLLFCVAVLVVVAGPQSSLQSRCIVALLFSCGCSCCCSCSCYCCRWCAVIIFFFVVDRRHPLATVIPLLISRCIVVSCCFALLFLSMCRIISFFRCSFIFLFFFLFYRRRDDTRAVSATTRTVATVCHCCCSYCCCCCIVCYTKPFLGGHGRNNFYFFLVTGATVDTNCHMRHV